MVAKEGVELRSARPGEGRPVGYRSQSTFRIGEAGLDPREITGGQSMCPLKALSTGLARMASSGSAWNHRPTPRRAGRVGSRARRAPQGAQPGRSPVRQRMLDRVPQHVTELIPPTGPLVQQRKLLRLSDQQGRPQHLGEEVVEPVLLAPVIQGDEEQVGSLEQGEHFRSVAAVGDGVARRPGQPVEQSCPEQEVAHRSGSMLQRLLDQVVDEIAVLHGELGDEAARILAPLDR